MVLLAHCVGFFRIVFTLYLLLHQSLNLFISILVQSKWEPNSSCTRPRRLCLGTLQLRQSAASLITLLLTQSHIVVLVTLDGISYPLQQLVFAMFHQ